MSEYKVSVKIAGQLEKSFNAALKGAQSGLAGLKMAGKVGATALKATAATVTAAGAAIGAYSVSVGKEFESQMSTVAAISGATGEQFSELEEKAKAMGATTQFSATEAGQAMEYMAMAGWKTSDMLDGIEGIMNLAAASGEDLAATSDIVTDALTAFGMGASESGRFADVLAAASSNANTNVSMMGESFKYVAAVAGTLGYSAEDTSVALGLMANAGIKGSQAGTSLKTALANMAAPTDDQAAAMSSLGIAMTNSDGSAKSLMAVMQNLRSSIGSVGVDLADAEGNARSYDDILSDLSKTTEGLSKVQQIEAAATIFGKDSMAGMLSIINASEGDFNSLTEAINNSSGAAAEMAAIRLNNLEGDLTLLKSGMEGLGIEIYQSINEPLKECAQKGAEYIRQLNEAFQAGGFSGLASAFVNVAVDALSNMAAQAPKFAEMAVTFMDSLISGIEGNAGRIANAAGAILSSFVSGVSALAPGIWLTGIDLITQLAGSIASQLPTLMANGIQAVGTFVSGLTARLPEIAAVAIQLISGLGQGIMEGLPEVTAIAVQLIEGLTQGIQANLPKLIPAAMEALQSFSGTLRANVGALVDAGLGLIMALGQSIISNIPVLVETIPTIVTNIAGIINDNAPKLLATGIQLIIQLGMGIIQAIPTIIANIPQIIQAIVSVFTAFNWLALGSQIITLIGNGIRSVITSIPQMFSNFVQNAHSIVSSFGWQSLGRGIIMSLANGIQSMITAIPQIFMNIGNFAIQALKNIDWWNVGVSIIQLIGQAISGAGGFILDAITAIGGSIVEGIKGLFSGADVDASSSGAAATQSYAAGIKNNSSAVSGAVSTLSTTAFSSMDMSGVTTAGESSAEAFKTGMTGSLADFTLDTSGIGLNSEAMAANMQAAGQAGGQAFTTSMNESLSSCVVDTSAINVDTTGISSQFTAMGGMAETGMASMNTAVQSGMTQSVSTVTSGTEQFVTAVSNGGTQAVSIAQQTASGIQAAFAGVDLSSSGVNMMQGLVNGINSMRGAVEAAAQSIAQSAANAVNSALDIHSPSRLMIQSGQYTGEGMAIGMENMSGRVQGAANAALAQPVQDVNRNLDISAPEAPARSSLIGETIDSLSGTGRRNADTGSQNTGGSPTFVFNPTYNLGSGVSREDVEDVCKMSMAEFDKMMRKWRKQNARTSLRTSMA